MEFANMDSICHLPRNATGLSPRASSRTSRKADRLSVRAQHTRFEHIPPDVSADVVNALEEQAPSRVLLPRTVTLFPPGFRGYWDSRARQSELLRSVGQQGHSAADEVSMQGSLFDSSNGSSTGPGDVQASADAAAPLEVHLPQQQQVPEVPVTGLQARLQAIHAEGQSASFLMQQSNSEDAQVLQLVEHASHWKTVHVVLQQLSGLQQPSMIVLEAAVLKLRDLGFDPVLLGIQGFKRQDWDIMGHGLSSLLASSSIAAPIPNLGRAVCVLEAMSFLGRPFHCRAYCDQIVARTLQVHQTQGPGSLDEGLLSRVMAACADLGHQLKQARLDGLVSAAVPLTPSMDAPALVRFLWACSKLRVNIHGIRLHVSATKQDSSSTPLAVAAAGALPEQALNAPAPNSASAKQDSSSTPLAVAAAGALPEQVPNTAADSASNSDSSSSSSSSRGTNAGPAPSTKSDPAPAPGTHTTSLTLLDFALSRLHHDLAFKHLTPSLAAQLLSALAVLDAQPEPEFMDDCLLSLLHPDSAPAAAQAERSLSPYTPRWGRAHAFQHAGTSGILRLLFSLTRLGYQPPEEVSSAILESLGQALQPTLPPQPQQLLEQPPPLPLPQQQQQQQQQQSSQQQQLQPLPADELGRAAKCLAALQITANTRWCQVALDALLATPGGPPLSAACRFLGALPDLIGPANKALRPWVSRNQPSLERLTLSIGPHLKSASCQDLLDAITGFAKLRYYPGKKFLQWHQAACWQAARKFPPDMLVMIRAAYTSLGYQAEQRLSMAMDKAQRMLTKRFKFQMQQAGEAAEAEALKASTPRLQVDVKRRQANKRKLRLGGQGGTNTVANRKGEGGSTKSRGSKAGDEGEARSQGGSEEIEGLLGGLDV